MDLTRTGDEFFGDDSDDDGRGAAGCNELGSGLHAAELLAEQRRYRTLGYHEAYDGCKDERLQQGFQDGYRATYEAAIRIGNALGRVIMQGELEELNSRRQRQFSPPRESSTVERSREGLVAKRIAQSVRSFVVDPANYGRLSELESRIQKELASVGLSNER
jgi:hypothetical protein